MTKMRPPKPGEPAWIRYGMRPLVWLAYQFSSEARFIRRYKRRRP